MSLKDIYILKGKCVLLKKLLMSNEDIHPNKFSELRSVYKYYIDSYIALYQLKTDKEEELKEIYKKIKT